MSAPAVATRVCALDRLVAAALARRGTVAQDRVVYLGRDALAEGVEVALLDPDTGERTAPGAVGEMRLRSDRGGEPAVRQQHVGAVLRPGELATQDDDGYLHLHDRLRDLVVSGGENVFPGEVEGVLEQHPAVPEAAVVGVPDERRGEVPRGLVARRVH